MCFRDGGLDLMLIRDCLGFNDKAFDISWMNISVTDYICSIPLVRDSNDEMPDLDAR